MLIKNKNNMKHIQFLLRNTLLVQKYCLIIYFGWHQVVTPEST